MALEVVGPILYPIDMLATPPPRRPTFSDAGRRTLVSIARATMPGGDVFPAGGAAAVAKIDHFFAAAPRAVGQGYRALLWALEAAAWLHHRRPLARLDDAQVLSLVERW